MTLSTRLSWFSLLFTVLAVLATLALLAGGGRPAGAQQGAVPAPPTGLTATQVTHDSVSLSWDDPGDSSITGYEVLQRDRDVHRAGLFIPVQANTGSAATSYTDDQVVAGARYIYRIKAINAHGVSTWSAPARANTLAVPAPGSTPTPAPEPAPGSTPTPAPEPAPELVEDSSVPDQPTGLASEASHDSVSLTWDDPGDAGISHYQILRRDRDIHASGEFVTINSNTNSAARSYTDDSAEPEQRYVYRVQAVNQHGASKWSSFARANTPAAPTPAAGPTPTPTPEPTPAPTPETDGDAAGGTDAGERRCSATGPCTGLDESPGVTHVPALELTNVSHDSVTLEWTAPAGAPPLGYVIVRTEDGAAPTLSSIIVGNTESQQTSYTDRGIEPRTLYTYWVSALRDTGVSAFKHAPSASATTAAAPDSVTEPAPAVVPYAGSPLAPSGLSAVLVTDGAVPPTLGGVQLDWGAPAEDARSVTGYQIRRGPVGDQHTVVLVDDTATADTAYLDASATDQSYYFYEVVALRGAEPSEPSETVYVSLPTVIPPPPLETAPASGHVSCGSSDPVIPGLEIEHRLRHVSHINGGKPFVDARVVLTDVDGADTWNLSDNVRFLRIGYNWDSNRWHSVYPVFWHTVEADEIGDWKALRQVPYGDEVELFAYVVRDSDSTIVPVHTNGKALRKCFTVRRSDTVGDPQPPQPAAGAAFDESTVVYFAGPTVEVDVSGWFTDPQGLSMNYYLCDQCDFYSWRSATSDNGRDYYLFPTGKPLAWSWISGSTLHIRPTNNLSMFGRSGGLWGPTDYGNIYNKGKGFVTVAAINSAGAVGVLDICFTLEYDAAEANRSTVKWAVNKRWPQTGTLTPCSTTFLKVAEGIALGQQP